MFTGRGKRWSTRTAIRQGRRLRNAASLALAAIALAAPPAAAAEQANPAHEIANRFAENGDKPAATNSAKPRSADAPTRTTVRPPISQTAPAQLDPAELAPRNAPAAASNTEPRDAEVQKAYEEEMLARAKAEAEARAKADLQREELAARERAAAQSASREKAERERLATEKAAQARRALEEESARIARDEETRRQRDAERQAAHDQAAQREQESRRLTERLRAARKAREEERTRRQAEAADNEARLEVEARRAKAAMRNRVDRLAQRIEENRRARLAAERVPQPWVDAASPIATGTTHAPTPAEPPVEAGRVSQHATILLVMTPGGRGIRRWNKSADPMLCVEENCYISRGEDKPAERLSRNKGFGPGIALGKRAGACSNQLACVFRDVDLAGARAWMQPVDLRIMRHDRRESRMIAADPTCTLARGRLDCRQTIESQDYRAWIVPEDVAREAGPAALHEALSNGLGVSHAAIMRRD